jgi:hypothetical protein
MSINQLSLKINLGIIFLCILIGLTFSSMPFTGWTHYTLEGFISFFQNNFFNPYMTFNIILYKGLLQAALLNLKVVNLKLSALTSPCS